MSDIYAENHQKDPAPELSDREKVIRLAEEVVGWKLRHTQNGIIADSSDGTVCIWGRSVCPKWNPLESIADAFEMQAKILADPKHADNYLFRIADQLYNGNAVVGVKKIYRFLLAATPRQRCEAALKMLEGR